MGLSGCRHPGRADPFGLQIFLGDGQLPVPSLVLRALSLFPPNLIPERGQETSGARPGKLHPPGFDLRWRPGIQIEHFTRDIAT